jgi:hypothetical protein
VSKSEILERDVREDGLRQQDEAGYGRKHCGRDARRSGDAMDIARITIAIGERPTAPTRPGKEAENDEPQNAVKALEGIPIAKQRHRGGSGQKSDSNHQERSPAGAKVTGAQFATDGSSVHASSANLEPETGGGQRRRERHDHPDRMNERERTKDRRFVHGPLASLGKPWLERYSILWMASAGN